MWTTLENLFLQILRIFFLITTSIALLIFIVASIMGINATIPRSNAYYAQNYEVLRDKTNAIEYLSLFIPSEDVQYLKNNVKLPSTKHTQPIEERSIFETASTSFLDKLFDQAYLNENGYKDSEKSGLNLIEWRRIYDSTRDTSLSESDKSLYSTTSMIESLYQDFATGLILCTDALVKKNKQKPMYGESVFLNMSNSNINTPPIWFGKTLNLELKNLETELSEKNDENVRRKSSANLFFTIAGGAVVYFVLVMFYFIFVKIERNLRTISGEEVRPSTHVKCPECLEYILSKSKKCKHCGSNVTPYPELVEKLPFKDYV
jgi:hypothetical protein